MLYSVVINYRNEKEIFIGVATSVDRGFAIASEFLEVMDSNIIEIESMENNGDVTKYELQTKVGDFWKGHTLLITSGIEIDKLILK